MIRKRNKTGEPDRILEEILENTKNQLKELSFSYEKLGQTLKKMPVCHWSLQEEEILNILGRISLEACEGCEAFYRCYRQEKGELVENVKQMLRDIERGGKENAVFFYDSYLKKCMRKESFYRTLRQSYEIVGVHRSWKNKMLSHRKLMAVQMEEVSRLIYDCSFLLGYEEKKETMLERNIKRRLKKERIYAKSLRIYENPGKRKEIFFYGRKKGKGCLSESVAELISTVIHIPMVPAKNCKLALYGENTLLHFKEDVNYHLLSGMAQKTKSGESLSGDLFSIFKQEQGKQVIIIADGMGSGGKAREEGSRLLELLEQLLNTGVHEEEMLKLVNSTFTFGIERSMYSSVDLLSVNLYTGLMKLMKSASAATFFIRKEDVEIIKSKNLPAGFLWEAEFDVIYKKLYDGDKVVLVSDGVLDGLPGTEPEGELASILPAICQDNPQQASEKILQYVLSKCDGIAADDMTVMVISAWKKSRR